jgi:hypothetical protein
MATLISAATGNFSSSSTWDLVDSTSFLDSEANNTALTTSFVSSSTFTPGAITIDGIAVKVASVAASPTGTISVRLFNSTGSAVVAGTTVTINVSDINTNAGGWYLFKFSAPVTLIAATNYTVQATTSSSAQVNLYRDATASNWSRVLRTTTTQAPASTDKLIIVGEWTAAATSSTFTVTMNNTSSATTYGEVQVCNKGVLTWGTSASTTYYLKLAGLVNVYGGGVYNMGTSGTPVPSTSTAQLEFVCSSPVQYGFEAKVGSTVTVYGATKTVQAKLAVDASASATSLTTDISTSWSNGDSIAIASTTRTASQSEKKALTADASGTTLTITAITNAHSGTSPTQGELGNLTRNVQIFSNDATNTAYMNIATTATIDISYVEFFNFGSATTNKRGIDIATTTTSCSIKNCSIRDFIPASSTGFNISGASSNNITLDNNVLYNITATAVAQATTTGTNTITNNLAILNTSSFTINSLKGTFTGNVGVSSSSTTISFAGSTGFGTVNNNTCHSGTTNGFVFAGVLGDMETTIFSNLTSWRNTNNGFLFSAQGTGYTLDTPIAFGNGATGFSYTTPQSALYIKSANIYAGTTLTQPTGILTSSQIANSIFDSCTFGSPNTHSTGDFSLNGTLNYTDIIFRNCLFASTNEIINTSTGLSNSSEIKSQRHDQTAGNHKTYKLYGILTVDTTIFNFASPSARLTPNSSTNKLKGPLKKIAVPNGQTAQISVYVRKSVVGDGSAYNGNQPRLILKTDPAMGVTTDTVLATASNAANGAFEKITGTTPAITDDGVFQVYVDCDGTAGWINVDDWFIQ